MTIMLKDMCSEARSSYYFFPYSLRISLVHLLSGSRTDCGLQNLHQRPLKLVNREEFRENIRFL